MSMFTIILLVLLSPFILAVGLVVAVSLLSVSISNIFHRD